jgi:hypothetical protein
MDDAASDHGVCSTINKWIDFMLRSRIVFVDIRGVRVHMSMRRGCPYSEIWWPIVCRIGEELQLFVDIYQYTTLDWWKRTHMTSVKIIIWSYLAVYLLGYDI